MLTQPNTADTIKLAQKYFHFREEPEHEINRQRFEQQIRQNNPKVGKVGSDELKKLIREVNRLFDWETELYFKDGHVGGYSTDYLEEKWNKVDLKCQADSCLFREIFEMDIRNGADPTKLFYFTVCFNGGWSVLKVK